jgi:hypothetical protein
MYRRVNVPNIRIKNKINFAGGSPAASNFLLLRQKESYQRKGDPGLPPLRGTLDQPQASGAAQLARSATRPRTQTVLAQPHRSFVSDRGGAQGMKSENPKPKKQVGNKLPTLQLIVKGKMLQMCFLAGLLTR